jgi:hypothetical protein
MARKVSGQKTLKAGSTAGRGAAATAKPGKTAKDAKSTKPAPPAAKAVKGGKPVKEAKGKDVKKDAKPAAKAPPGKAPPAEKAPPKKKRSKSGVVRLKAYWGVFNQMMKRVHLFEYSERRQADKKAAELSGNAKSPHFVQLVKEVIRDAD